MSDIQIAEGLGRLSKGELREVMRKGSLSPFYYKAGLKPYDSDKFELFKPVLGFMDHGKPSAASVVSAGIKSEAIKEQRMQQIVGSPQADVFIKSIMSVLRIASSKGATHIDYNDLFKLISYAKASKSRAKLEKVKKHFIHNVYDTPKKGATKK